MEPAVQMSDILGYEARLAVMSLWTGAGLMVVYDLLRILRLVIPHHTFWVGVEDTGYWIYSAFMTFGLLYEQNNGRLRGYVIAGVFLGMLLYEKIIGKKLLKYLKKAGQSLKMIMRKHRSR